MKRLLLLILATAAVVAAHAQLLTWTPSFPRENSPLTITVDATKGNAALVGFTGDVYVHLGVITSRSVNAGDWKYPPFAWGTANPAAKAVSLGNNKWSYTISPNLRAYFGITDGAETIRKVALLFRSATGDPVQRNRDGSDMYIPVYGTGLAARVTQPYTEPRFAPVPEPVTWTVGTAVPLRGMASRPSDLKLYHNGTLVGSSTGDTVVSGNSTVAAAGLQQFVVEAREGTTVVYDTVSLFVGPAASPVAALPAGLRDGINYEQGDTSAVLVLHAPGKNLVSLLGDFNNWTENTAHILNKTPDGQKFWIRLTGLRPGTEYGFQYQVDNGIRIGDPYAQKVLDPWNDSFIPATTYPNLKAYPAGKTTGIVTVLQTAAPAYTWSTPAFSRPDKRGLVIYELLLRDFLEAHDWKTLRDTLNYLKNLGVNAIELLPFNEFEGNNSWGYNPDFYFAPDKYYGPANTLKQFIDSCHAKGMAVIMDIALNHSFGLSPMVQLYFGNNQPLANSPWFNPVPKHPFNVGYDMNHESAATKYFVGRVVEHWLQQYKIDGFRFDLSKGFTQNNTGDNVDQWGRYDASRIAIWKGYYDTVQAKSPGSYVILEHFAENNEEKELADYGMLLWGNLAHNYQEAAMGYLAGSNFEGGIHTVRGWTKPHLITYMESHDEERIVQKNINFGNSAGSYNVRDTATALKRMELNAAFLFTIPGPKMLWQFGELGYDYSINYCPSNGTINNNCRVDPKPIRWDYLGQARRKQVYNTYSRLINLRFHPWYREAFLSNRVEHSLAGAFKWIKVTTDTSNLVVVGNFGMTAESGTVTFPSAGTWYDLFSNAPYTATGSAQTINLQPGAYHVYVNRNVNNTASTPVQAVPQPGSVLEAALYPNPVTASFTVSFNNPQSGNVSLELWDGTGRQLGVLGRKFYARGSQQFSFTPGAVKIPAGVYYLKLVTPAGTKTLQAIFH